MSAAEWRTPELEARLGETRLRTVLVTPRDILHFAQAIGEHDPIHRDETAARARGYAGIVAPLLFCQTMTYEDAWPEALLPDGSPVELDVPIPATRAMGGGSEYRVRRLVRALETITVTSRLAAVERKDGRSGALFLVTIETTFTDADGEEVAMERATYVKR